MSQTILLDVPISEAIDKWTILNIKLDHAKDPIVRQCVENELGALDQKLNQIQALRTCAFYVKSLKHFNCVIYDFCDQLRALKPTSQQYSDISALIVAENDARFRVKRKIDRLCQSRMREVKNYQLMSLNLIFLVLVDKEMVCAWIQYLGFYYDNINVRVLEEQRADFAEWIDSTRDPTIQMLGSTDHNCAKEIIVHSVASLHEQLPVNWESVKCIFADA
jgi:rRNA-processing protein FCF1